MTVDNPTYAVSAISRAMPSMDPGSSAASNPATTASAQSVNFAEKLASASSKTPAPKVEVELSAAKKFEAVFVAQMMAEILPEDSNYFGDGFAGDAWRSMLAEQIANVAVTRTDFGIAPLIENGFNMSADQKVQAPIRDLGLQPDLAEMLTQKNAR